MESSFLNVSLAL
jgi:hypothetical protein